MIIAHLSWLDGIVSNWMGKDCLDPSHGWISFRPYESEAEEDKVMNHIATLYQSNKCVSSRTFGRFGTISKELLDSVSQFENGMLHVTNRHCAILIEPMFV